MMSATQRLGLALAVGVFLSRPGHAQDSTDDIERLRASRSAKLIAEVREGITRAAEVAKKNPREAIEELEVAQLKLLLARPVSAETRKELMNRIEADLRLYRQRLGVEDKLPFMKERKQAREKAVAEMYDMLNRITELTRQGKFAEAAELS